MLFKVPFQKFDFRGFIDFVCYLGDKHKMDYIYFYPDKEELFTDYQLKHIAPYHDINNQNGFVWAWRQMQDRVRNVDFDLFTKDNAKRMRMGIKLDDKVIYLDRVTGISPAQIEKAIKDNMVLRGINTETPRKVAILNKGKNNSFLRNIFKGNWDVGIQDEGEGMLAAENKFHNSSEVQLEKAQSEPKKAETLRWHQTWWGGIIIGIIILIIGTIIVKLIF